MKRTAVISLIFGITLCCIVIAQQTNTAPKKSVSKAPSAPAIAELQPTINNGLVNESSVASAMVNGEEWLWFTPKKGTKEFHVGRMVFSEHADDLYPGATAESIGDCSGGVQMTPTFKTAKNGSVCIKDAAFKQLLAWNDSELTFLAKVHLQGLWFQSDEARPLVFKLVRQVGAVYVSGSGTVTTEDGSVLLKMPVQAPKPSTTHSSAHK